MRRHDPAFRRFILSAVPSLAGWRSGGRGLLNISILGLAVLVGTWTVHQLEYTIEYGRRFSTIMATTPHRFYMGQAGPVLTLGVVLAGAAALFILVGSHLRLARLRRRLPPRARSHLAPSLPAVPLRAVAITAALLSACQIGIYLLQENLETLATTGALPGLGVLLAAPHLTVLPLHLLLGLCGAVVLRTASAWLQRSRRAERLARVLLALYDGAPRRAPVPTALREYHPGRHPHGGSPGLRAPPVHARGMSLPSLLRHGVIVG